MTINRRKLNEDTIAASIAVQEMIVDEYQGHVNKNLVEHIANNWNPDAAGAVILNLRDDGSYAVLDGQHRVLAAKIKGITELDSLVHIGKSREEEAVLFVQLNHKHNVLPMDRFRANLIAGHADEKNVRKILQEVGLDVALTGPKPKGVQCIGTLMSIYQGWGTAHFKQIVGIVAAAYKDYDDPKAYTTDSFAGMAQFLARYPEADTNRVIQKLSERAPVVMLGMAAVKKDRGQENSVGWGRALTSLYNTGYRAGSAAYLAVDEWDRKVLSPAARKARSESEKVKAQVKKMREKGVAEGAQLKTQKHPNTIAVRFKKGHTPFNKGLKAAAKSKKQSE